MMFKKISIISSILFFLLGTTVFAHSHLESSSPKNGEVLTQQLKDITLTFETTLEKTSTFTLQDTTGAAIPLAGVSVEGNKLVGTLGNDLTSGNYKIHWKIIGIDGHPLEGDIPFSVQLPESQAAENTADSTTAANDDTTKDTSKDEATVKTDKAHATEKTDQATEVPAKTQANESSLKNYVVPVSVALVIFLGLASYWLIFRRKNG